MLNFFYVETLGMEIVFKVGLGDIVIVKYLNSWNDKSLTSKSCPAIFDSTSFIKQKFSDLKIQIIIVSKYKKTFELKSRRITCHRLSANRKRVKDHQKFQFQKILRHQMG